MKEDLKKIKTKKLEERLLKQQQKDKKSQRLQQ